MKVINFVDIIDRVVDLYHCRWWGLGRVDWRRVPKLPCGPREYELAVIHFKLPGDKKKHSATIWVVHGHVFEIVFSEVPRAWLNCKKLENVDVKIKQSRESLCDTPARKEQADVPSCLQDILGGSVNTRDMVCFEPRGSDIIRAHVQEVFLECPEELERFYACTDGLTWPESVIYGIDELWLFPHADGDVPLIGEALKNGFHGGVFFVQNARGPSYWWYNDDETEKLYLGNTLADSIVALIAWKNTR